MRKQDQLQELIHGLSANEKRHFKMLSTVYGDNKNYLILFDTLNELPKYDVETVSKRTNKSRAALAHSKEHLKDMLLRSLRIFSENSFATSYYNRLLEEVELLHSKGQYVWAYTKTENALKEALKEDAFVQALQLFRWYHTLAYYVSKGTYNARQAAYEKRTVQALMNEIEYQHLLYRFNYLLNEKKEMTSGKVGRELAALMNSELLINKKRALSRSAQIIFHRIHGMYGLYISLQMHSSEKHFKTAIQIFKKNPSLLRAKSRVYCLLTSGLFGLQNSHGKYARAYETLNEMEETLKSEKYFSKTSRQYGYTLLVLGRLYNYVYSGQYNKAIEYAESIQQHQQSILKQAGISFKFDFHFVTALSYWKTGNLKNALKISHRLMQQETNTANVSVMINRFLFLLIQFDLGNFSTLSYLINNHQRWCRKEKLQDSIVTTFNRMLADCCKAAGNRNIVGDTLKKHSQFFSKTDNIIMNTLDIEEWINSKTNDN
ncbi:MAG: hypothetical protein U0T74_13810 [Chitinophagales bacterium]